MSCPDRGGWDQVSWKERCRREAIERWRRKEKGGGADGGNRKVVVVVGVED